MKKLIVFLALYAAPAPAMNYWQRIELLHAVDANNLADVRAALDRGANINVDDQEADGEFPLWLAAKQGRYAIAKLLIERGADVNKTQKSITGKTTPLMIAARNGHHELVKLLVDNGAEVNYQNENGRTALMEAAWRPTVVLILLHGKASVDLENDHGDTALAVASPQSIPVLIQYGANPNHVNRRGKTVLMQAVINNRVADISALIQGGAEVDLADSNGTTPLMEAIIEKHAQIIPVLIEYGADPDRKDRYQRTALQFAKDIPGVEKPLLKAIEERRQKQSRIKGAFIPEESTSTSHDQK